MASMDDGLTPAMRRLWERGDEPGTEAKPGLTAERIVAAAVALADADGLAAVSMARVARALGFTTMSLYRHVAGKDELLELMADAATGQPPALDPGAGWRAGLERWSRALVAALLEHPWFLQVTITGPPRTPGRVAWFERGLEALAPTGLTETEKAGVILLVNGCAFWEARVAIEVGGAARARGTSPEAETSAYGAALGRFVTADRFPRVRRAIDAGIFEDDADDFAFGLQLALDGVERLVERRAAAS
jgi:AcrR family transcriptional regulator